MPTPSLTNRQEAFLLYGPTSAHDDAFIDESEVIAAWGQHRERICARYQGGGRRPWGFWAIDHPELPWRGYDKSRSTLWAAGLLDVEERVELETMWRTEFEKAEGLDEERRRKHHHWADIPRLLLREWNAERRRRGKAIRKPEATASPELDATSSV